MDENVHGAKVQHLRYNVKHASGIIMVIVTRVLNVGIFMTGDIMISINKTNPNSFRYFVFLNFNIFMKIFFANTGWYIK